MCIKFKNTSIVPFTAGSGINYSGEYNSTGELEFVNFSNLFLSISSSMLTFIWEVSWQTLRNLVN